MKIYTNRKGDRCMPTPPNQIYSFNPTQVIVTNSFAENVKKLKSMCIPPAEYQISAHSKHRTPDGNTEDRQKMSVFSGRPTDMWILCPGRTAALHNLPGYGTGSDRCPWIYKIPKLVVTRYSGASVVQWQDSHNRAGDPGRAQMTQHADPIISLLNIEVPRYS